MNPKSVENGIQNIIDTLIDCKNRIMFKSFMMNEVFDGSKN